MRLYEYTRLFIKKKTRPTTNVKRMKYEIAKKTAEEKKNNSELRNRRNICTTK